MRESLAESALSRALNVYVCPACGMDEALRDAAGKVLPISEWYAVKQRRFAEHKDPQAVKLTPACAFMEIFCGARKTLPLSGARYPASLVAYSRSDYDGWRWWTTWFPDEEMRPAPELVLASVRKTTGSSTKIANSGSKRKMHTCRAQRSLVQEPAPNL